MYVCIYVSTNTKRHFTPEIWRRNVNIGDAIVSVRGKNPLKQSKWSGRHNGWDWEIEEPLSKCFCIVCVVFPPQNNVSILLKWVFAWLLMLPRIKLCRFNGMDLFTFGAQRHHVNIQNVTFLFFRVRFSSCFPYLCLSLSLIDINVRHTNSITSHAVYSCSTNGNV